MGFVELLAIAIGLALDASAVSFGAAAAGYGRSGRAVFRLAFHFALFQAFMPLLGWLAGVRLAAVVAAWDHWVAFGLLAFVGIRMIRSGLGPTTVLRRDPSRGATLVMLAVATSIDAFAVGLSLAMLGVGILLPCIVIGVVTAVLSLGGILLGGMIGSGREKIMEIAGGALLVLIGIRIVLAEYVF
jgi:putative Mn2+ efflux pump MntP